MSIIVRESEPITKTAPVATSEEVKSAPESTPEQKQITESETVETEAEETNGSDVSEENDSEDSDKPKKKSGFKRRIDKLSAKIAERERELEYWKSVATKPSAKADEPQKSTQVDLNEKPNPENFDSHAEYVEALTDWKVNQKYEAKKREEEKSRYQSEYEKTLSAHKERVDKFAKTVGDFEEVLSEVEDIQVSAALNELIVTSENGPELIYELAKNRSELERIASLGPIAAARELGKIEARLSASANKEIKKTTTAPKPISAIGKGNGATVKSIFDQDLSQSEYERLRREQLKQRA